MATFNFINKEGPSDKSTQLDYIQSSAATQHLAERFSASTMEMALDTETDKATDFSMLQLVCLEEAVRIQDTRFDQKQIFFKTNYPVQFLFISTKILTDPTLSRLLVFNGIKCDKADAIESVEFIVPGKQIPPYRPDPGEPLDLQIEIEDLIRILIIFKIERGTDAFDFSLRIKDRNGTRADFLCDPQVGNDPPAPVPMP